MSASDWINLINVAATASIAWFAYRFSRLQAADETKRAQLADDAALRRQQQEDAHLALGIHEELTSPEVLRLLESPERTTAELQFLKDVRERALMKLRAMKDTTPEDIVAIISDADDRVRRVAGPSSRLEHVAESRYGRGDRSRYSWRGVGSFSKHEVLQQVVLEFAKAHPQLTTKQDFLAEFRPHLQTAIGDATAVDPERLLVRPGHNPHHQRVADKVGRLELGGESWVIRNSLGGPEKGYPDRQLAAITALSSEYGIEATG